MWGGDVCLLCLFRVMCCCLFIFLFKVFGGLCSFVVVVSVGCCGGLVISSCLLVLLFHLYFYLFIFVFVFLG